MISDYVRKLNSYLSFWCKNNIKPKNIRYMSDSDPITDFFIQTISRNNIISNSSFSYWAAYINESRKKVIAPSLWFGFRHNYNISVDINCIRILAKWHHTAQLSFLK